MFRSLLILATIGVVAACTSDTDCNLNTQYCNNAKPRQCVAQAPIGAQCSSSSLQMCSNGFCNFDLTPSVCVPLLPNDAPCKQSYQCNANSWCKFNIGAGSTCVPQLDNGQSCSDTSFSSRQCKSGYCNTQSGQCDTNPFDNLGKAVAFGLLYIILLAAGIPIVICISICCCCYFCGRGGRTVVVKGGQPHVVVASTGVPMQPIQQPYYVPQQQAYQPLQYGGPQQQQPQYPAQTTTYPDITKNTTHV